MNKQTTIKEYHNVLCNNHNLIEQRFREGILNLTKKSLNNKNLFEYLGIERL